VLGGQGMGKVEEDHRFFLACDRFLGPAVCKGPGGPMTDIPLFSLG